MTDPYTPSWRVGANHGESWSAFHHAVDAPSSAVPTGTGNGADRRIGLLAGTELIGEFRSSGYREPSHLVCRADGRIVRLAPVPYGVVGSLARHAQGDAANSTALLSRVADEVGREAGLDLTSDHVAYLLDRKLAPLGITTDSRGAHPVVADPQPVFSLRFKKAILPSRATALIGGSLSWLFYPPVVVATVLAVLAAEIWLFAAAPMGSAFTQVLAEPLGVLVLAGLAIASAWFHELGHATACRYGGARPGPIGGGFYLIWPVFYTDISDTYRLERSGRLRAVLGGVYFNAVFLVVVAAVYALTGYAALLAVILIVNLQVMQQLLPTLRFDGYFIMSDLVGVPDLYRYIGPILRRTLLRQTPDARLAALKERPQRAVTAWVMVVIPILILQVGFILLQLPTFVRVAWQKSGTTLTETDMVQFLTGLLTTLFALLPLAALGVLVFQAGRGVAHLLKNAGTAAGGPQVGAPGLQGGRVLRTAGGWSGRSIATVCLIAVNAVVLVVGAGYIVSGQGARAAGKPVVGGVDTIAVPNRFHTSDPVTYPQTPPVGGPHNPNPAPCAFYSYPVVTEMGVHSLEHGAIWVTYRPDVPPDQVDVLERLAQTREKVLVSPWNTGMRAPIVVSSWGRQLALQSATDPRLVEFAEAFTERSPEPDEPC